MPTNRQTYPIQFSGGLITSMSPLQQGINAPGSARNLVNFEPSVEGGYRRILGYSKYDSAIIPPYGAPVVHGDGQTGTNLTLANIREEPEPGDVFSLVGGAVNGAGQISEVGAVDGVGQTGTSLNVDGLSVAPGSGITFTITGDTTVYTVSSATALVGTASTLTITPAIINAPADNAVIRFNYAFLNIDGLDVAPSANDTFTIAGDTTVYTISAATALSGTASTLTITPKLTVSPEDNATLSFRYTRATVSFNDAVDRAVLTLNETMVVNPSNADPVTFVSTISKYLALGCGVFLDSVIVAKNEDLYQTTGNGYSLINIPSYGTVLVNGGSQTGSTIDIDGLDATPQIGDIFKIDGVDLIYTITATPTVTSGAATVSIDPALAASPADDAAITFLSTSRETAGKTRFSRYNYTGIEKIVIVDGTNVPALYDRNIFTELNDAPSDVVGAKFVVSFKNQLFFGKDNLLVFTAPFTDNNFTPASGSGTISVGASITGLIVFREQLIIFTESSILQLTGSTISDFQLRPVTNDIGCINEDTIQEIGGDIMFLAPDGLRLLSATDRIGDFGLGVVSKNIQDQVTTFVSSNTSFASVVIREKSQYRILGYNANVSQDSAEGILCTQFSAQGGENIAWAELKGIRAYVADSRFYQGVETIVFANNDGYLYQMEDGNSFDSGNIEANFSTPYMPINDPRVRKTFYKMFLYTDPQGGVTFDISLKLDFDQKDSVQPTSISLNNTSTSVAFFGTATFGSTAVYSTKLLTLFEKQLIGSGFVVSVQYASDGTDPPFSLDAMTLEYTTNTRR